MKSSEALNTAANFFKKALTQELRDQGHYLTGSLERSINNASTIEEARRKVVLRGFALDYSIDLDQGAGPNSKNLPSEDELRKYFLLRGLPPLEAAEAAYLTARRHKKEGMPTKASARFSKTGERTNFIKNAWSRSEKTVDSIITGKMDRVFEEEAAKQKSEKI